MSAFELPQLFAWTGIDYLFNPHKRVYWLFILTSILIALLYLFYKNEKLSDYLKTSFWLHPSAKLDYGYFLLISLIKTFIIFPVMLGVGETAFFVLQLLNDLFGYHPASNINREVIILLYTITLFISGDFTRYWLHRWLHSSDILWQFHKVHHSAKVLTPMTFYRVHPVENILFGLRYAVTTGVVTGIFIYLFGARLQLIDILGVNLFIFLSLILGANLRHSPIHLRYPKVIENWLISPAQHQYHYTANGARKNYAGVLALWDRMFGSLHYSEDKKSTDFGLPEASLSESDLFVSSSPLYEPFKNDKAYQSLTGLIFSPFFNIHHIIINSIFKTEKK